MFKVGDVAIVRKDLKVGKSYGGLNFPRGMDGFIGKKVEIIATTLENRHKCYNKELGDWFYFSPEMLEPIPKAKEYRLIVTDKKVIIIDRESKKKGISTCHKEDTFDMKVGFELAWNRLNGIEEAPKKAEPKLYDCNGVELKDEDKVKNICLNSGSVYFSYVKRNSDGILYNIGLGTAHRADKNGGRCDRSKTVHSWFIVKI